MPSTSNAALQLQPAMKHVLCQQCRVSVLTISLIYLLLVSHGRVFDEKSLPGWGEVHPSVLCVEADVSSVREMRKEDVG